MRNLILLLLLVSCNPVRQVLSDKQKLDEVAKEVVRLGYCSNDTTIILKSDTITKVDSLIEVYSDTVVVNDTTYINTWETKNFIKTFTIHDTLHSVLVDNARVRQLQDDILILTKQSDEHKNDSTLRLYWFIIACAVILFLVLYKIR